MEQLGLGVNQNEHGLTKKRGDTVIANITKDMALYRAEWRKRIHVSTSKFSRMSPVNDSVNEIFRIPEVLLHVLWEHGLGFCLYLPAYCIYRPSNTEGQLCTGFALLRKFYCSRSSQIPQHAVSPEQCPTVPHPSSRFFGPSNWPNVMPQTRHAP